MYITNMNKPNPRDLSVLAQEARAKKLVAIVEEIFALMVAREVKMSDAVMIVDVLSKKVAQSSQKLMAESDLIKG